MLIFDKTLDKFITRSEIDVLKSKAGIENDHIIRIDYTQINNVGYHIEKDLILEQKIYFSNDELYIYITDQS